MRQQDEPPDSGRLTGDRAVKSRADDRFGWSEAFLPILARVTREWPAQEGLTFGLYGAWGSGKSSVLHLLEEHLRTDRDRYPWTYVVRFNPWFYDDPRALIVSFFSTLGETMAAEYAGSKKSWSEAGKLFKKVGKFLAVASRGISFATIQVDAEAFGRAAKAAGEVGELAEMFDRGERELQEQRDELERLLAELGKAGGRVMVLVDDVDRLDSGELIGLLRLLRTVAELPAITLIVAADEGRIRQVLDAAAEQGYGRAYLEKIVQAHLHVPLPDPGRMDALLHRGIADALAHAGATLPSGLRELDGHTFELLELRLLRELIRTPRDLGRYLNGLRLLGLARPAWDLDAVDAALLAGLQVFFPDAYERVRRSRLFLTEAALRPGLRKNQANLRRERRQIWCWILTGSQGTEPGPEHRLIEELIGQLFGEVVERRALAEEDAAAARRIRSPEIFDSYFAYATTPLWLSRDEVRTLVAQIATHARAGSAEALASRITNDAAQLDAQARSRLRHDLGVHLRELDREALAALGRMLEELADTLEHDLWSLLWHAWLLALRHYRGFAAEPQPLDVAEERAASLVRRGSDPLQALRFRDEIVHLLAPPSTEVLDAAWLDRWRAYLAAEGANAFRDFSAADAVRLVRTADRLETGHVGAAQVATQTRSRLAAWLRDAPAGVVALLARIVDDDPPGRKKGRTARTAGHFAEIVGSVDVAAELLRNALRSGVEDPAGLVADTLEHLARPAAPGSPDDPARPTAVREGP